MNFGQALEALKAGRRVARAGWNGKGMWLALTPGSIIPLDKARDGAAKLVAEEVMATDFLNSHPRLSDRSMVIAPHIDMRTATGSLQVGWLASQADMLGEDWAVLPVSTGLDILERARSRIGEAYRLGISVDLDDPDYHGRLHGTPAPVDPRTDRAWDCAELVSWAVLHACGQRVGCGPDGQEPYTGHWAQAIAVDKGPAYRIPVAEALNTPGAILLRAPASDIGGHIGISTGTGRGIVEAHSTSVGVVERSDAHQRRWSAGVCIRGVLYQATGPTQGYTAPAGVLRQGQRGLLVERLQVALRTRGYDPGPTDGDYGPRTARAVRAYQVDRGLVPDGEAGPVTLGALGVS